MGEVLSNDAPAMMVACGLPWTIIRVASREEYMRALEIASCENNIIPFTRLVIKESQVNWNINPKNNI